MDLQADLEIPATDWTAVASVRHEHYPGQTFKPGETPESCCDGGKLCPLPVEKPERAEFHEFLDWASKEVATWPQWKRDILGRVDGKLPESAAISAVNAEPIRRTDKEAEEAIQKMQREVIEALQQKSEPDLIRTPPHYTFAKIEPLDAIQAWDLPFALGNVVKYVVRAGRKGDELIDLEKAAEYLRRYIEFRRAKLNEDEPIKVSER